MEKDLRIQELETLVAQQQARIAELEALDTFDLQQEVEQLQAIIEAQEEAMADQKKIIASQSTLLDDLSGHLSRNSPPMIAEDIEDEEVARNSPSMPRTPNGSSAPVLSGGSSYQQRNSRGSGVGGSRSAVAAVNNPVANRRTAPPGRGAPGAGQSTSSGSHSSLNARSQQQREQMHQKLHARAGGNTSSTVDHPRAPRPNSAVGRGGATPRARSWTDRGSGSAPTTSARGPSPTRSPDSTQSSQHSQYSVTRVMNKTPGGPLPPALPLLRSET